MNDFTKEDLYQIYKLFDLVVLAYPSYILPIEAKKKIKVMFDNYCEHEWVSHLNLGNNTYSAKCRKCGDIPDVNQ